MGNEKDPDPTKNPTPKKSDYCSECRRELENGVCTNDACKRRGMKPAGR